MHVVALLSCMLASMFGAEASARHPTDPGAGALELIAQQTTRPSHARPALETPPTADSGDGWHWVEPLGRAQPGVWVSHPPVELAVDLLGVDAVQKCVEALGRPSSRRAELACAVEVAPCQRLVLPTTGPLRLELDTACFRGERDTPLWSVRGEEEPPRVEPSPPKPPTGT